MKKIMLKIENLIGQIDNKIIIKKLNLEIKEQEIHFLMGPNGCGKSTLSKLLVGHPSYSILDGKITFLNKNLCELNPDIRAKEGLFLAFQHPIEIEGINNLEFLKIALDQKREYLKKKKLNPLLFIKKIKKQLKILNLREDFLDRDLNVGFSGGEKKLNELLQILLLKPKCVLLDEIDSGLDIDGIKRICSLINNLRKTQTSFLIITHNPKISNYIKPDYIHVMIDGAIKFTGGRELIDIIEEKGYETFKQF